MSGFYRKYGKRLLDILCASSALVFFFPLILLIAFLVRQKLGNPIYFIQERPGQDQKIFKLYKFRTMTDERDSTGNLLDDSLRLTDFGKFLRATSLDELPQLWNILIGDMSIVGPRPLLIDYLVLYNPHQQRRHQVRPGLTGYAQVSGRNSLSWIDRFNLDVDYVDQLSFALDCQIILRTIKKVLARDGINSTTAATMEAFTGNKESHN